MTVDEAKAFHAAYLRPRKGRPPASEYMQYMLAKKVLAGAKLLTLTAGQRGFLAAARMPGDSRLPVSEDQPVAAPAPAPAPTQAVSPAGVVDEPPPWVTEDAGLSDAAEFPAPNGVGVAA